MARPSHPKNNAQKGAQGRIQADLYGIHAVREAWLNPARKVTALYGTQAALEAFEDALEAAEKAKLRRPTPFVVDRDTLDRALPRDAVHQGLALACAPLPETGVEDLLIKTEGQARALFVMLDQVTDPHNVGAIARSAAAFGADGLILQRQHAPEITGVLAKAASGAVEHIPFAYETNLSRTLEHLQREGFTALGLDEAGTTDLARCAPDARMVLVLGAEGAGLRRLVKEHCDVLARLPTGGPIGTLNVSNAAAVALYALKVGG